MCRALSAGSMGCNRCQSLCRVPAGSWLPASQSLSSGIACDFLPDPPRTSARGGIGHNKIRFALERTCTRIKGGAQWHCTTCNAPRQTPAATGVLSYLRPRHRAALVRSWIALLNGGADRQFSGQCVTVLRLQPQRLRNTMRFAAAPFGTARQHCVHVLAAKPMCIGPARHSKPGVRKRASNVVDGVLNFQVASQ